MPNLLGSARIINGEKKKRNRALRFAASKANENLAAAEDIIPYLRENASRFPKM